MLRGIVSGSSLASHFLAASTSASSAPAPCRPVANVRITVLRKVAASTTCNDFTYRSMSGSSEALKHVKAKRGECWSVQCRPETAVAIAEDLFGFFTTQPNPHHQPPPPSIQSRTPPSTACASLITVVCKLCSLAQQAFASEPRRAKPGASAYVLIAVSAQPSPIRCPPLATPTTLAHTSRAERTIPPVPLHCPRRPLTEHAPKPSRLHSCLRSPSAHARPMIP